MGLGMVALHDLEGLLQAKGLSGAALCGAIPSGGSSPPVQVGKISKTLQEVKLLQEAQGREREESKQEGGEEPGNCPELKGAIRGACSHEPGCVL